MKELQEFTWNSWSVRPNKTVFTFIHDQKKKVMWSYWVSSWLPICMWLQKVGFIVKSHHYPSEDEWAGNFSCPLYLIWVITLPRLFCFLLKKKWVIYDKNASFTKWRKDVVNNIETLAHSMERNKFLHGTIEKLDST